MKTYSAIPATGEMIAYRGQQCRVGKVIVCRCRTGLWLAGRCLESTSTSTGHSV